MNPSGKPSKAPLIASVVVIVILAGAAGYIFVTSSATIASQAGSIGSLNGQVSAQGGSISSLTGVVSNQAGSISSLTGQVGSLNGQVNSLNGQVSSFQTEVASLDSNITHQISARSAVMSRFAAANATIASQKATMGTLSSEITSYSSEASSQASVISAQQSTISLQVQSTLSNSQRIDMAYNSSNTVAHFVSSVGGYVQISGTATTSTAIAVCYGVDSQAACDSSHTFYIVGFGYGGTVTAPLEPGPVWINIYNLQAGSATLTLVLFT
jgi:hypothetical protein